MAACLIVRFVRVAVRKLIMSSFLAVNFLCLVLMLW